MLLAIYSVVFSQVLIILIKVRKPNLHFYVNKFKIWGQNIVNDSSKLK